MKLNYGKTFLLGFGFFGVSVIWGVYNAFVPLFLANKFGLAPAWIGFFMTLDNIAALLIQPPVGAWSDKLRTPLGRRMPFILIGAPVGAVVFGLIPTSSSASIICSMHQYPALEHGFLADPGSGTHAGYHTIKIPFSSEWDHQFHGWSWCDHIIFRGISTV